MNKLARQQLATQCTHILVCNIYIQVYRYHVHCDCFWSQLRVKTFEITLQDCIVTLEAQVTNHLLMLQRER